VSGPREAELLRAVLESGTWSSRGPREREFEQRFAAFCGARFALCVANGSVALEIALRALRVGEGDEVIVPALTWPGTAWAVLQAGATPIFADVRPEDWCIDPESLRECITPHTRAVIPVHLYDQVAELDAILEIADEASLCVIEDCAHAHGSRWRDQGVGALGRAGAFSFQAQKAMTAGEGGALITNDPQLADRIYALKDCGRPREEGGAFGFGGNHRITEFQAAILLAQLERLEQQLETRERHLQVFRERMASIPGIDPLPAKRLVTRQGMVGVSLRYDRDAFEKVPRKVLVAALAAEGIPADRPYPVVYRSELWSPGLEFLTWPPGSDARTRLGLHARCPVAERIAEEDGLVLPHWLFLAPEDVEDAASAFAKIQAHASELRLRSWGQRGRDRVRRLLGRLGAS
jgi:L-glutamine:2-deoxy-scyllo-inosose/3-amino-2,3-dideoxy-scyllo-inosose aminotransferase